MDRKQRVELKRDMLKQLERISWLTETLLKISQIDSGTIVFQKERITFEELVNAALAPFEIQMEVRSIQTVKELNDAAFTGDRKWTLEAVSNLLKNALEHSPDNSQITIRANETPLFSELIILDEGEGIDPKDLSHIFERFYKGENASSSSIGIGLALCRMIISSQDGTITARNREKGGTEFRIRLMKSVI